MPDFKLGKKEAQPSPRDFKLREVLKVSLPGPTSTRFGNGYLFGNDGWAMLGNDRAGDCVFAGADHETMLWNKLAGHSVTFTDRNALDDYGAVTGYDPDTGENDNGTYVKDAMKFRQDTGVVDSSDKRHKIDAYVSIEPGDWGTVIRSVYTFGVVGIGFEFPDSAWDQLGDLWEVSSASIDGGHYVPLVGSMNYPDEVTCITWGKRQRMSRAFFNKYCDEAWVPLSKEVLKSTGLGLHSINWDTLQDMLNSL